MVIAENRPPIRNLTRNERPSFSADLTLHKKAPDAQTPSLFATFGAIETSETEAVAMKIIDRMKLDFDTGSVLYFYHLWHDDPNQALIRIKALAGEIREDIIERVKSRVNDDDSLAEQYDKFYQRYTRATEKFRKEHVARAIRENVPVEEAAEEAEVRLSTAKAIKARLETKTKEPTLEEGLEGKELSDKEKRALQSADLLNIPLLDKKFLMGAYVFLESGIFRGKDLLGLSFDQSVNARDRVRTNEKYEKLWNKFELLMRENYLEVASFKKDKVSHRKIAEKLGISVQGVNEMSKTLIAARIVEASPRARAKRKNVKATPEAVSKLRAAKPPISNAEIAKQLGVSLEMVEKIISRLILTGEEHPDKDLREIARRRERVRELWNSTNLQQAEIAAELAVEPGKVRYDLIVLRREGKVLPQKPGKRRREIAQPIFSQAISG